MDSSELLGGMYKCSDCGYIAEVTKVHHLRPLNARTRTKESFYGRCPRCYRNTDKARRRHDPTTWNTFYRLGLWKTVVEAFRRTFREV